MTMPALSAVSSQIPAGGRQFTLRERESTGFADAAVAGVVFGQVVQMRVVATRQCQMGGLPT